MTTAPRIAVLDGDPLDVDAEVLAVPVFKGGIEAPGAEPVLRALGLEGVPRDGGFSGQLGETTILAAPGLRAGRVALVGLGRMDRLDEEAVRRAAGALTRALATEARTIVTTLPLVHPVADAVRAAAEGAILGAYRFDRHRSAATPVRLEEVRLVVPSRLAAQSDDLVRLAGIHAHAQCVVRDLVNTPAVDLGPADLVERARELAGSGIEVEVWDVERLEAEGCGGVLGVGQGSARPPCLLILRYRPDNPLARVALVGKGIVFDSGGLSLKRPSSTMETMKDDMAGAAAVIAAMHVLPDLDVPVEVIGVCGIAENAISGSAQRPGDVVTHRDGTTVEVLDTDAEGRLVLADALAYAVEQEPEAIVDLATLTGSALHAVGARATAAFGNDDDLVRQILTAAGEAGEPTWRLPLWRDLEENLESDVADLNNTGDGEWDDRAGATMGALFLQHFVGDVPWVHLDLAAAWGETARHHLPQGGTGTGVRTILRWLEKARPSDAGVRS